jgi:hypothetical protein
MNNNTKRILLFLFLCIGTRSLLAYIAYKIDPKYLPYMGVFAMLLVLGWFRIIFFVPRDTGPEVFGGKIWWKDIRPIHMMLWLLFAIFAFKRSNNAWKFLAIDVMFGLLAFIVYHVKEHDLE